MRGQQQFDLGDTSKPEVTHPGQLSFPDWLRHSDTVFHSSFRADWEQGPMAHVGTQASASDRLVQSAVNISPREGEDPRGGRIWARRLAAPVAYTTPSDSNLNTAESALLYDKQPGQYASEKDAADIIQAHAALSEGKPVAYKNAVEDIGTNSVLAPRGTMRAWHQDVQDARAQGLDVHPHDVALADQQFDPAIAITPRSMRHNVERYTTRHQESHTVAQQTMFPASTYQEDENKKPVPGTETLFPQLPTIVDRDNWGKRHPGRDARERAQAHAESTGHRAELRCASGVQPRYS